MTTIICLQCAHIVLVQPDGLGHCVHCSAGYKVTIEQVRESPLDEEKLKDRANVHRG